MDQNFLDSWQGVIVRVTNYPETSEAVIDSRAQLLAHKGSLYLCTHTDIMDGTQVRMLEELSGNSFVARVKEVISSNIRPFMIMENKVGAIYYYEIYDGPVASKQKMNWLVAWARKMFGVE